MFPFLTGFIGGKAFPQFIGQQYTTDVINNTSKTIVMPAGIIQAGDIILVIAGAWSSSGVTSNLPAGYTSLTARLNGASYLRSFWKTSSGSESNITFTANVAFFLAASVIVIRGAQSVSAAGSVNSSGNSQPNSPNFAAPYGSDRTLWYAIGQQHGSAEIAQTAPANYTMRGQVNVTSGGADAPRIFYAERELEAASEDPGVFGNNSALWIADTLAIRPL